MRRVALSVVVLVALSGAPVARADNQLYMPTIPHSDDFYAQPDPAPSDPPGTILDWRKITFRPLPGVEVDEDEYPAWQLK